MPRRNWCMSEELAALQEHTFAGATRATAGSYPPERRLSARQLGDYLDRRAFAVIGSCRPDGRPHAAMSAYIRQGREFWLPAVGGSVRERNVCPALANHDHHRRRPRRSRGSAGGGISHCRRARRRAG